MFTGFQHFANHHVGPHPEGGCASRLQRLIIFRGKSTIPTGTARNVLLKPLIRCVVLRKALPSRLSMPVLGDVFEVDVINRMPLLMQTGWLRVPRSATPTCGIVVWNDAAVAVLAYYPSLPVGGRNVLRRLCDS